MTEVLAPSRHRASDSKTEPGLAPPQGGHCVIVREQRQQAPAPGINKLPHIMDIVRWLNR